MRPDFSLLQGYTISGSAYLNGTRLVKTTDVFPLWNRKSWEEKKEVESLKKDGNSQGSTFSEAVMGSHL